MSNIFENAKFGDKFLTRNGSIAYYGRYDEKEDKHFLMVSDFENDWILCYNDGHVFHFDEEDDYVFEHGKNKGKTIFEVKGWNKEEMVNFRLDIVSRFKEMIDEEELDKSAGYYYEHCKNHDEQWQDIIEAYKAGYREAKQE